MTTAAPTDPVHAARRSSRLDRQARVGILRNPVDPPKPPPRRATLMGRWPNLRSGRRPPAQASDASVAVPAGPVSPGSDPGQQPAVQQGADGRVTGIDIAALMATVADGTGDSPARTPFAASMRADGPADTPSVQTRRPRVLTAEAWLDLSPDALAPSPSVPMTPPAPPPAPASRWRLRRGGWVIGLALVLVLVALALVPLGRAV